MSAPDICIVCHRPETLSAPMNDCRVCGEPCHTAEPCAADYDVDLVGEDWRPTLLCAKCRKERS